MSVQQLVLGSLSEITEPTIQRGTISDVPPGEMIARTHDDALPLVIPDRDTLIANGVFGMEALDLRARTFLLLRTQLMSQFYGAGGRVLAITSTQPGNGKTFVTANVASALSSIHPTILVDLDLRRPTLASRFGLTLERGIDDYLAGEAEWSDVGIQIGSPALTLYGVREPRRDSAKLLSSDRLVQIFSRMREMGGAPICIVDTPPALVVDDIMLVSGQMDGILIVIEEGSTRTSELEETLRILAPCPIVGSVLNKSLTAERISRSYDYYDFPS